MSDNFFTELVDFTGSKGAWKGGVLIVALLTNMVVALQKQFLLSDAETTRLKSESCAIDYFITSSGNPMTSTAWCDNEQRKSKRAGEEPTEESIPGRQQTDNTSDAGLSESGGPDIPS